MVKLNLFHEFDEVIILLLFSSEFLEKLHGPGPHRVTVSDLKPNTTYKVNVESHGECRTQQSSTAVVTTALGNCFLTCAFS